MPSPTSNVPRVSQINMMGTICRSCSFAVPLLATILVGSAIIVGAVLGQQTGQLPGEKNETSSGSKSSTVSTTNSNNYAASVSLLTSQSTKPQYRHSHHKYFEKMFASGSKPSVFSSGYSSDPVSAYYSYHAKHAMPVSDSYYSQLYSPYMMPVGNYYTGSSSTVSSVAPATEASSYQYSHYYPQAESNGKNVNSQPLSFKEKLMKSASTTQTTNANATKEETEQEKMIRQLHMALLYQQLMSMNQYRSQYGSYSPYNYPNQLSSLYNYYGALGGESGSDSSGSNPMGASSSPSASTASASESESDPNASATTTNTKTDSTTAELQALASVIAYRQQLAQMYKGMYGGGAGGLGGNSLYGGSGSTFGFPSSLYGGGYGSSGLGSTYSSLYGSAMPTGHGGVLSSLTSGLSSFGSGLGVLNTLGMLFG